MPRHSDPHPENGSGLYEYTERQLAELAVEDPTLAAQLSHAYNHAVDRHDAGDIGMRVERERADRLYPSK